MTTHYKIVNGETGNLKDLEEALRFAGNDKGKSFIELLADHPQEKGGLHTLASYQAWAMSRHRYGQRKLLDILLRIARDNQATVDDLFKRLTLPKE